ncbi:MAG: aspartate carbamoyltransferase regulatory subunit [Candidatus Micrarchaeota archaeon]|nr:aspartate carbamoyltransferase regulatory subunit [Candidatus Micrarchaeota archaeon]
MLNVEPLENGTVIDHIKSGKGKKVLEMLGISELNVGRVALVMNVPSKRLNKKDIVKIEGAFVSENQTNLVALISPNSTINIIKNGKVSEKRNVILPKVLDGIGKCPNPNCMTNLEHSKMKFLLLKNEEYTCHYCERSFNAEELVRN